MHDHIAIVSFLFLVSTVDHGAPHLRQCMTPFFANSESARATPKLTNAPTKVHIGCIYSSQLLWSMSTVAMTYDASFLLVVFLYYADCYASS